ncbi:MAG: hypothetical protein KDD48_03390 [Bdellovibrionales bacterium]|nr:hypothetical protein [Bdellovibrionales bacterium]
MKNTAVLKPDKQGRISLPEPLKSSQLVQYELNPDGSILIYPVRTVREYPDMSDLPESSDLTDSIKASLHKSLSSTQQGVFARSSFEALKAKKKK